MRMRRRKVLTAIGATAATGTAGCSGGPLGGSDNQSDGQGDPETPDIEADPDAPAQLVLLEFDVPEAVVYGDEFEVEVVIGNTGGEPTESDAAVDVARFGADFEDGQTVEVNASDLGSGETRSQTVGPLTATAAGEFRVAASDGFATAREDAAAGFDVAPQQAALGDQVNSPGTLRVTVTDITYEQALLYNPSTDSETSLRQTLDDRIIAVLRVTAANSGGEAISVPEGLFVFETGSRITGEEPAQLERRDLRGATVNPGERVEGYVATAIDVDVVGEIPLGLQFAGDGTADVEVDVGGNPGLPSFELADRTVPSQFNEGVTELRFEIENTGDADGTFRGFLEYQYTERPGAFSSVSVGTYYSDFFEPGIVEIPAGETRTVSFTTDYGDDVDIIYRIQPFEAEYRIEA